MARKSEGYVLRYARGGRDGRARRFFTVPDRIARQLPPDAHYDCILTDEGVLYRPTSLPPLREDGPKWLRDGR